jgi:Intrinsic membrane protein PufX
MSDKHYINQTETQRLRSWILSEMLSGAGKAALFVVLIGVSLYAIYLLGLLLPEESKQAPSPQQQGAIEAPVSATQTA